MSITRTLFGNRHAVWASLIAIVIFGVLAYVKLPMQLFPDTAPPLVNIITLYPGAAAEEVADNVNRVLEDEFMALEGAAIVKSTAQDNLSLVSVEFQYHRDVNLAAVDVQNAIASIRGDLPANIREPQVLKFSTNDRPIITVGVAGRDLMSARKLAEDVFAPRLQRINGVAAIDVFGGYVQAVLVDLEPRELEAHRIPFQAVAETIKKYNTALPAGQVRTESAQTMFRVESRAKELSALEQIPLTGPDGSRTLVGDLGHVERGTLHNDSSFAINGKEAIALQVYKTNEANTVEVVDAVEARLESLRKEFPDYEFIVGEESASFTRQSIGNLIGNVWEALLLATVIIFLFLTRWGSSFVAGFSMVLAYGITFAAMYFTNTELNMVTLTAIILGVGMVVDASVVVVENAERKRIEEGLSPTEAVIHGTDEVFLAVMVGGVTALVVLVPLLFLPGFVGKTFGPLARTLLFAFIASPLVALFVIPLLTTFTVEEKESRLAKKVTVPFNKFMDRIRDFYLWLFDHAIRRRALTLAIALVTFVLGIIGMKFRGMDVLPKMDSGSFYVSLETPSGSSLEETRRVVRDIETILAAEPEVVKVQAQAGFEAGMKTLASSGVQGPTQGFISVTLTPRTERDETIWDIERRVREKIAQVPGIQHSTVRELGNTAKSTTAAPVVVRVTGEDPLILDTLGDEVVKRMKEVPHVVEPTRNWRRDMQRTRVVVDNLRAGQLGLSPASVAAQMASGSNGIPAGDYHGDDGTPYPVLVRYAESAHPSPGDLLSYPILVPGSPEPVPLRSVAKLKDDVGQGLITREGATPTLDISAYVDGKALNFVVDDVAKAVADMQLPEGYELQMIGENNDLKESRAALAGALGIAVLAVYLLLVVQLKSFLHPITIMMTIPLSISGVAAALWIAGKTVSMPVMVSLVLLVGAVVNSAIILFEFIEQGREAGLDRRAALRESIQVRFRPIMITAISTIVGMVPLAFEWSLGAERFAPLAVATMGGMTTSTFLTLVVIPVIYDVFEDLGELPEKLKAKLAKRKEAAV